MLSSKVKIHKQTIKQSMSDAKNDTILIIMEPKTKLKCPLYINSLMLNKNREKNYPSELRS